MRMGILNGEDEKIAIIDKKIYIFQLNVKPFENIKIKQINLIMYIFDTTYATLLLNILIREKKIY